GPPPGPSPRGAAEEGGDRARPGHRAAADPRRRADRRARLAHRPGDHAAVPGAERPGHDDGAGDPRGGHREIRPARPAFPRWAGHMSLGALLRIALRALAINKLRSALTMLGIVIGVGAVIVMIAVGAGAQARVEEQIRALGSNLLLVMPGSTTAGGVRMGFGSGSALTEDDGLALHRDN